MAPTQKCPLCGGAFDLEGQGCRPACPLAGGCGMLGCPRCGFGFPREERGLAGMIRKALLRLGRSS